MDNGGYGQAWQDEQLRAEREKAAGRQTEWRIVYERGEYWASSISTTDEAAIRRSLADLRGGQSEFSRLESREVGPWTKVPS